MNELEFKILLNEKLCDLADAILFHYNPCERRINHCLLYPDGCNNLCCQNSAYFLDESERICQFIQHGKCGFRNIACKIWLCATAMVNHPECVEDLRNIENIANRYGLAKRPFLGQGYVGRSVELAAKREREVAMTND